MMHVILRAVALLPRLRQHSLRISGLLPPIFGHLATVELDTDLSSPLETLTVGALWTFRRLLQTTQLFPHLKRLDCQKVAENSLLPKEPLVDSATLTHLVLHDCRMTFNVFEFYIKKICRSLRTLRLGTSWQPNYLDADRWEQLIKKHMPCLRTFSLTYEEFVYGNHSSHPEHERLHRFSSKFWTDRQLMLELNLDSCFSFPFAVSYAVRPYK